MIVSVTIKARYDELARYAPALKRLVRERLEPICDEGHYGLADRIKALDSLAEKLESGRVKSWDEIDDLYAATVVVPSLRDEAPVLQKLGGVFKQVDLRQRCSTKTPPDVFRFDSPRFVGRLHPSAERAGSPVESMLFEVQVRTAFEHAWSTTTHALSYKADHVDWKRHRLAAALRASVEQIDLTIAGFERTADEVIPGKWDESQLKLEMLTRFRALFETGRLPSEVKPSAWNRFIDNVYSLCRCEAERRHGRGRAHFEETRTTVHDALASLEGWAADTPPSAVPRSLSLYQTAFGVFAERGVLASPLDTAIFGIDDIATIFPRARDVASTQL
jgi:ppGpp synthetase/RelA/SpoT-type nucleotidyltranferase